MHAIRKALVGAMLAASAFAVPAATPAMAGDCTGAVVFLSGTPTLTTTATTEVVGTFDTVGPGYSDQHCDLGWITTCELYVNGLAVPATCNTHYTPEPDRCPATGSCLVDVRGSVNLLRGQTAVVTATLGMRWGCCGYQGGPESTATGTWTTTRTVGGIVTDCEDLVGDVCRKVDPRVKVLIDDL